MTRNQIIKQMLAAALVEPRNTVAVQAAKSVIPGLALRAIQDRGYNPVLMIGLVVNAAQQKKPITYGELEFQLTGQTMGVDTGDARIGGALGELTAYFWSKDLPLFNVYVVNQKTGKAGAGFLAAAKMVGRAYDETTIDEAVERSIEAVEFWSPK